MRMIIVAFESISGWELTALPITISSLGFLIRQVRMVSKKLMKLTVVEGSDGNPEIQDIEIHEEINGDRHLFSSHLARK